MSDERVSVVLAGTRAADFPRDAFEDRIDLVVAQTDEELRTAVRGANVLFSWSIPSIVPSETPGLRWVQLPSAGVDHILRLPVWQSDITITSSRGVHTVPMAEHFFAMILALTRQIAALVRAQREHEWLHDTSRAHLRLTELRGQTLGVIGWGGIGDGVAHLARAFGMRVIGTRWSVMVPREVPRSPNLTYSDPPFTEPPDSPPDILYPSAQLHDVLAQSDIVLLVLPLTDETRGSFGDAEFAAMKRGAIFVNIGRGPVVAQDALLRALQSGRLTGAALDVFAKEPLPPSSPLWTMSNVIISPHLGGMSDRTSERATWLFAVNLTRYLEGQPLLNVVERDRGY